MTYISGLGPNNQKTVGNDTNIKPAKLDNPIKEETQRPVEDLILELSDLDRNTRERAAFELSTLGQNAEKAVPRLAELLANDPNKGVRAFAVIALGNIGEKAANASSELINALFDNDEDVRTLITWTLGSIGREAPEMIVPGLIDIAADKSNGEVRENAIWALAEIGSAASKALPLLKKILGDKSESENIRTNAAFALIKIGKESSQPAQNNNANFGYAGEAMVNIMNSPSVL